MQKLVDGSNNSNPTKVINFRFSSPILSVNCSESGQGTVKLKNLAESLNFDFLIECTGFRQQQSFFELAQDENGRILTSDSFLIKDRLYTCGWSRTGPKGNIADSIAEASNCATAIYRDLNPKVKGTHLADFPYSSFNLEKFTRK